MKKLIVLLSIIILFSSGCTKSSNDNNEKFSITPQVEAMQVGHNELKQQNENNKQKSEIIHPIDKAEQECMKNKFSTVGMNECSYKARDAWSNEIDKNIQLLEQTLSPEDFKLILKAQNEWVKYKNAEFEAISLISEKEGTMFQNSAAGVKTNIVKERALELKRLYEILNY